MVIYKVSAISIYNQSKLHQISKEVTVFEIIFHNIYLLFIVCLLMFLYFLHS